MNNKRIALICALLVVVIAIFAFINTESHKKYSYQELSDLPQDELYKVFLKNGLKIDEDLKKTLTDEQIAHMLKQEFDLLIQGATARSHTMYFNFAKVVEITYKKLLDK